MVGVILLRSAAKEEAPLPSEQPSLERVSDLTSRAENHKGFFFKLYENEDTKWINQKDLGNKFGLFVDLPCSLHTRGSSPQGFQELYTNLYQLGLFPIN